MNDLTVIKFGGSTMGIDGQFIPKIIQRIKHLGKDSKILAVFSAPLTTYEGKKHSMTDVILKIGKQVALGNDFDSTLIKSVYQKIIVHSGEKQDECNTILDYNIKKLEDCFSEIKKTSKFTKELRSKALAYSGELLMGQLMNCVLNGNNLCSSTIQMKDWPIITDDNTEYTNFLHKESLLCINPTEQLLEENNIFCIGGFIGKTSNGVITTFERGGSDRTAAILAILFEGKYNVKLDFEKDTPILSADPNIVKKELSIVKHMSYNEARIASMFGMKILDPIAIKEILTAKLTIPITITDINDTRRITTIQNKITVKENPLKIIAAKHNCVIIRIPYNLSQKLVESLINEKQYSEFIILSPVNNEHGIFSRILFLDADYVKLHKEYFQSFDTLVSFTFDRAVLTLVGDEMSKIKQIVSLIATQIGNVGVNILNMDAQEETSRIVIVLEDKDDNMERSIQVIHQEKTNITY